MLKFVVLFLVQVLFIVGCGTATRQTKEKKVSPKVPGFYLSKQKLPPPEIKSIQFSNQQTVAIPNIRLNSKDQLNLRFDEVTNDPHTFGIRFARFDRDWNEDGQVPTQISDGQLEDIIELGIRSDNEFPEYFQSAYDFPNSRIKFRMSGNWMVEVFDYQSGETIFSLPFLISEQSGNVENSYETLNEFNQDSRFQHQHFVWYHFSNDIQLPEYNVSVFAIQDGRFTSQKALSVTDFSSRNENVIRYHHERNDLFAANYDHQKLDLKKLRENSQVRFVEERGDQPPLIRLFDDNPAFEQTDSFKLYNAPSSNRFDRYTETEFSFVPNWEVQENDKIFVTGLFQQNALYPNLELVWNNQEKRFTTNVLLKQGEYTYSYEVLRNGKPAKQLAQNPLGRTVRTYTFLVYYKDPTRFIDRLLFVKEFQTE
jgi:hypothetical protein